MSRQVSWAAGALWVLVASLASAQQRPSEADMFGSDEPVAADAGAASRPAESDVFSESTTGSRSDAGAGDNDSQQLNGAPSTNKFDSNEMKVDPLKIGGSIFMQAQVFGREGAKLVDESFSAPTVLETYLDARPNDRVRAFVNGRLTYDPTRATSTANGATNASAGANSIGVTSLSGNNPNVQLDQLWLRFDILQKVYLTVGRQKVRWGVSRIWYPTDFLNSQPRDALNPFDARLGVNMVKVHVPIESLGWNFYAYGLFDNIDVNASGFTLGRIGAAARAEFVLGPAEITGSAVYMPGRRPRYAFDISTPLGPIDLYGEVAIRSAKDFTKYNVPGDLTEDNFVSKWLAGDVTPFRPTGVTAQASGGASYSLNYTDKNTLILGAEYFFNPMGYQSPAEYLVQSFLPSFDGSVLDPAQRVPLYQGKHSLALTVTAPGLPDLSWVTLSLSNIINFSDPSGLARLDAIFRVLTYLNVQAFASVFYGQPGGELRCQLPASLPSQVAPFVTADQLKSLKTSVSAAGSPPLFQAGVLLRLSI